MNTSHQPPTTEHGPSDPRVQVTLRPIATALPLGYLAFALGMIVLAGDALGWFDGEQNLVGITLAAYVFPLQLVATVMAFLGRDSVGATILGLFTTSWLSVGLIDIVSRPGDEPTVLGVFSISFGVVVLALAVVTSRAKPLFCVVLVLCAARAVLEGIYVLGGSAQVAFATGCVAIAATAGAAYLGLSLLIENAWPRPILPIFRRGAAASALKGDISASPSGIFADPGVRDQL